MRERLRSPPKARISSRGSNPPRLPPARRQATDWSHRSAPHRARPARRFQRTEGRRWTAWSRRGLGHLGTLRPGVAGLTCCEPPDLSNPLPLLSRRIDYVFARGFEDPDGALLGTIDVVGNQPGDRVQGPAYLIWPSDHAGVVASLR